MSYCGSVMLLLYLFLMLQSPQDICTRIGLCADFGKRRDQSHSLLMTPTYDDVNCGNCKFAVKQQMEKLLQISYTEVKTGNKNNNKNKNKNNEHNKEVNVI